MGVISLISPYFRPLSSGPSVRVGQIVWAPVPNLEATPMVIEAERPIPTSHGAARARFTPLDDKHFSRKKIYKLPILSLHLGETEELLAFRAKKRPCVIVGTSSTLLQDAAEKAVPEHHREERVVVAPIYDLSSEEDPKGFDTVMATRVRHLLYRQFFPIASWTETRTGVQGALSLREGILRFDRLQFIFPAPPALVPWPLALTEEVMELLHAWLHHYFHAPQSETLREVVELVQEKIPPEANMPARRGEPKAKK